VALGVRLSALPAESSSSPSALSSSLFHNEGEGKEEDGEEDDLDDFLSTHGLEFIDVDTTEISQQRRGISQDGMCPFSSLKIHVIYIYLPIFFEQGHPACLAF
jgi:hypothetical protein